MKKILVVEDDENFRCILEISLGDQGYEVIHAETGEAGLQKVRSARPDIILLDILLPDMNGFEVCRRLKSDPECQSIPILIMTTLGDSEHTVKGLSSGADDYVNKPFDMPVLLARVRTHIQKKELHDSIKEEEKEKSKLLEISQALSSTLNPQEILFAIVSKISETINVERCSIIYADPEKKEGHVMASHDAEDVKYLEIDIQKYPEIKKALVEGEAVLISDASSDPILHGVREALRPAGVKSILALPVIFEDKIIGSLVLRASRRDLPFNEREMRFCRLISHLAASPLKNAFQFQRLKRLGEDEQKFRLMAEGELKESEEKFRTLVENSPDCISLVELDGKLAYMNSEGLRQNCLSDAAEIRGCDFSMGLEGESLYSVKEAFEESKKGRTTHFECLTRSRDGKENWWDSFFVPLRDGKGKTARVIRVCRNITKQKQTTEELRKLYMAVEQSPVNVVITDSDGNIEYINPNFTRTTGYALEEALGKNPRILKSGEMPAEGYKKMWETLVTGNEWRGEFHNKKKNGELYWESAIISPVKDALGKITHYLGVKEDITVRKRMEKELEKSREEAMMQTLFAQRLSALAAISGGISHELSQPLSVIGLQAETMKAMMQKGRSIEPDSLSENMDKIIQQIDRAVKIIEHMKEFSSGAEGYEKKTLPLKDMAEGLRNLISAQLKAHRIDLRINVPEELTVLANRNRMEQVLLNLISNARDSLVEKRSSGPEAAVREISLRGFLEGQRIILDVSDTGTGIPEAVRARLFDPFVTSKKAGKGSGLGLSICQKILRDYGAEIELLSTGTAGTAFRIKFQKAE
ncbi:MAG: PAS domain S-box protein [Nitrospinae bacterium]|nr:PAS domain S-box protein [Nitrospinota bacterium]